MAGVYVHVPFCNKLCSYCDFYKTSIVGLLPDYIQVIEKEIEERKDYLNHELVDTLYFGGGTPSLLNSVQILDIIHCIKKVHRLSDHCEITLEANPDDLSFDYLKQLLDSTPVNRLSIGVQSFNDDELRFLNRRHNASQAMASINHAIKAGFINIGIDLIYGLPAMTSYSWQNNLSKTFSLGVRHISAYCLSIEPGTSLSRMLKQGLFNETTEEKITNQYSTLCLDAHDHGFIHYEISNFAMDGYQSRHNSNYWFQKKYLGIGPSAHSYNNQSRQWNVSNLREYIAAFKSGIEYFEKEEINDLMRFNEYLMVSLRTTWGVSADKIINDFGQVTYARFLKDIRPYLNSGQLVYEKPFYKIREADWLISDYIISGLMQTNDK
jgi:oxygen-independent coproporphyrinogen III oxidase